MPKKSAGLLLFRYGSGSIEVLLVHPGGPYWAHRDAGSWSIPKGEFDEHEQPLAAAKREFAEETGATVDGDFIALLPVRQASGKLVHAWAVRADFDPARLHSNTFSLQWPPQSGQFCEFPEVDRAAWFDLDEAKHRIVPGQVPLLDQLRAKLGATDSGEASEGRG